MMSSEVQVPVDAHKTLVEEIVQEPKKGALDTKLQRLVLDDYKILDATQHTFINSFLQLSNQVLGLKQQYQKHIAAIDDISNTIKQLKSGEIREIYQTKGGMFLVKEKVTKDFIHVLQKRREEIINANNMTVGQLEKNYELFKEYSKKVALMTAKYLENKDQSEKILETAKEIDKEAASIIQEMHE